MTTSSNTNLNSLNEELNTASKELEARKVALLKDGVQIVLEEILNCIDPLNLDFNTLKIRQQDLINLAAKTIAKACSGRLLVPHFSLSADKTSPLWV